METNKQQVYHWLFVAALTLVFFAVLVLAARFAPEDVSPDKQRARDTLGREWGSR